MLKFTFSNFHQTLRAPRLINPFYLLRSVLTAHTIALYSLDPPSIHLHLVCMRHLITPRLDI